MKRDNLYISPKSWEIIMESIINEEIMGNNGSSSNSSSKFIQNFCMMRLGKIKEMSISGTKKAVSLVSDLTGKPVEIGVASVMITTPLEIKKGLNNEYRIFTGINFSGDISGVGVLKFSEKSALTLSKSMLAEMGMDDDEDELNDMKISAINEACNLIISAYVDTLANSIGLSLDMSPPFFNNGIEQEIMENIFKEHNTTNPDVILTFKSKLYSRGIGSGFDVLMMMPPKSINLLFQKI